MPEAPRDTLQLLSGLLGHMRQIVGDGACYAMVHYGALEEGKRIAAGAGAAELPALLGRMDALLLQSTEIVRDEGERVVLRVRSSRLLAEQADPRAAHGLLLGLVEGALTASRAARFRGTVVVSEGELRLDLHREG